MHFLTFFHELRISCLFLIKIRSRYRKYFYQFLLNILCYNYSIYSLYAGNINLNREDEKSIKKYNFLVNMPVKTCFSSPNVL